MKTAKQMAKLADLTWNEDRLELSDQYEEEGDLKTAELLRDLTVALILWDDDDIVENPFPSVGDLARQLAHANQWENEEVEIRLQIQKNGHCLWSGDPSYDTEHGGYWASAILIHEDDQTETAKRLIEQALDDFLTYARLDDA